MTNKADSKFKIVGAASVAAKVTRDCCIEGWHFEESEGESAKTWSSELGSGYPSGMSIIYQACLPKFNGITFRPKYASLAEGGCRPRIWIP